MIDRLKTRLVAMFTELGVITKGKDLFAHASLGTVLPFARHMLKKRHITDRLGGWVITALLLMGMYTLSAWSDVSPGEYATRIISFTNTVAPAPAPVASSSIDEAVPTAPPVAVSLPKRAEISLDRPKISLTRTEITPTRLDPDASAPRSALTPQLDRVPLTARLNLPDQATGVRRRVPRGLSSQTLLPTQREGSTLALPATRDVEIPQAETEAPVLREEVEAPEVRVLDAAALSAESEEALRIGTWISEHHETIPSVVQRHMDFEDGDKTTKVDASVNGNPATIYLMTRQGYSQLHILLVIGDRSYFYINRGGSDRASRFRVGELSRDGNTITRITSQERSISEDEAELFYQIFGDWWATASP